MSQPLPLAFHPRVASALSDRQLHTALDRATRRFAGLRAAGLASLQDPDAERDRAREIRSRTLRRLDEHLERFEAAVGDAGGHVHWALDAAAARDKVLVLARSRRVRRVVKSKSMLSEEVGLNHALEAAGIEVVESDLGEYIIQLAHETPSHIIAPAFHKTKEQVGRLLHETLGVPLTDDPAAMTRVARERLRDVYLSAGMGISGVNFGVAETGSLVIVTNEGNASLATSAPGVHVALMGIERLVATLDELGVMLRVLARSATGQKLSVYTDVITGPRRRGALADPDGPEELHVVLVDNGRSRVLGEPTAEILFCIRCGACLNACPVYGQIGGHAYGSVYSGPVGAVLTPAIEGLGPWKDLPQASSLCGACKEVCPVRIDIPRMLLHLRAESTRQGLAPWWQRVGLRAYRWAAVRPGAFRAAASVSGWLSRVLASQGWLRCLPPPLDGWTAHRDFPAFAARGFGRQLRRRRREAGRR
jgi:L-lactate dehydrogenase complex protein LldF